MSSWLGAGALVFAPGVPIGVEDFIAIDGLAIEPQQVSDLSGGGGVIALYSGRELSDVFFVVGKKALGIFARGVPAAVAIGVEPDGTADRQHVRFKVG